MAHHVNMDFHQYFGTNNFLSRNDTTLDFFLQKLVSFFWIGFFSPFQMKQTLKTFKGFFHQMGDFLKERMGWILMTFLNITMFGTKRAPTIVIHGVK